MFVKFVENLKGACSVSTPMTNPVGESASDAFSGEIRTNSFMVPLNWSVKFFESLTGSSDWDTAGTRLGVGSTLFKTGTEVGAGVTAGGAVGMGVATSWEGTVGRGVGVTVGCALTACIQTWVEPQAPWELFAHMSQDRVCAFEFKSMACVPEPLPEKATGVEFMKFPDKFDEKMKYERPAASVHGTVKRTQFPPTEELATCVVAAGIDAGGVKKNRLVLYPQAVALQEVMFAT